MTYKSDDAIAREFDGFTILGIEKYSEQSGRISVDFPDGGEHVGGGATNVNDGYIVYDSGVIAFDSWYPDAVYRALCEYIRANV